MAGPNCSTCATALHVHVLDPESFGEDLTANLMYSTAAAPLYMSAQPQRGRPSLSAAFGLAGATAFAGLLMVGRSVPLDSALRRLLGGS